MTIELCPKSLVHGVGVALSLVLAIAVSGCDSTAPVAAPTSTLPAPAAQPTPTVPPYETDLDLNAEEKEAVEGALLAFDGYIKTINRVFASGGTDTQNVDQFARAGSLESLKSEAKSMKSNKQYMAGKYKAYGVHIESVNLDTNSDKARKVSIIFCTKDSEWSVVGLGDPLPTSPPKGITMQHIATDVDGTWKVANQYLRSKECESI